MNEQELMALTKEQLQDLLRAAGLPVSGKLEELRARLRGTLGDGPAKAEESPEAMPVLKCPGCARTTLDRLYTHSQVQAVTCYATTTYPAFRIRYCACRACGRRWKDRAKR